MKLLGDKGAADWIENRADPYLYGGWVGSLCALFEALDGVRKTFGHIQHALELLLGLFACT